MVGVDCLYLGHCSGCSHWVKKYSDSIGSYFTEALLIIVSIGLGAFQANIIQFGIDQLHDAPSDEIVSFIIWYMWTGYASGFVAHFSIILLEKYKLIRPIVTCVHLSVALCLLSLFKGVLIKEPVTQNPFKLVYHVIRYAIENKHMRYRSAFTYCEDELPSHMDFGKKKYGTTEQVEDVKTFLRLLAIITLGTVAFGDTFALHSLMLRLFNGSLTISC